MCYCFVFFFFKQKTAYEMRISDWSSDVCSSDLFAEAVKDLAGFQSWQVVLHYGTHPMKEGNLPLFQRVLRFSLMLDLIGACAGVAIAVICVDLVGQRSEEHTSELQSLMRISYAVFCLKKKTNICINNIIVTSTYNDRIH